MSTYLLVHVYVRSAFLLLLLKILHRCFRGVLLRPFLLVPIYSSSEPALTYVSSHIQWLPEKLFRHSHNKRKLQKLSEIHEKEPLNFLLKSLLLTKAKVIFPFLERNLPLSIVGGANLSRVRPVCVRFYGIVLVIF